MLIRRFADLEPVPWRNGGGITREVLRVDAGDDFAVRVSIADVDVSGPFSLFDGVDRVILLLDGPGMRLDMPTGSVDLRGGEPFAFDGGASVRGEIMSPTRDLNVMTRRGLASARMQVLAPGESGEIAASQVVVVALDEGASASAAGGSDREFALGKWDCAIAEGPVSAHGPAAVIVIDLI